MFDYFPPSIGMDDRGSLSVGRRPVGQRHLLAANDRQRRQMLGGGFYDGISSIRVGCGDCRGYCAGPIGVCLSSLGLVDTGWHPLGIGKRRHGVGSDLRRPVRG